MRKGILIFITIAIFSTLFLAGCGGYEKLLKSKNHELMYKSAIEYYKSAKYDKAISLFEEVAPVYVGTGREDTVMFYWGSSYYKYGDFGTSEVIFDRYRRFFAHSPMLEEVEYMYCMGFYFQSPEPNRDQTVTNRAISAISEYIERYPKSIKLQLCRVRIDELQQKLYDKELINAKTYYQTGRYKSAVIAFRNALNKYPETPHREEILYLTTKSSFELAYNSVPSLQRDRYLNVLDSYYTFVAEFPNSKYRKELDKIQDISKTYLSKQGGYTEEN